MALPTAKALALARGASSPQQAQSFTLPPFPAMFDLCPKAVRAFPELEIYSNAMADWRDAVEQNIRDALERIKS